MMRFDIAPAVTRDIGTLISMISLKARSIFKSVLIFASSSLTTFATVIVFAPDSLDIIIIAVGFLLVLI